MEEVMALGFQTEEITLILTMAETRLFKNNIRVKIKVKDLPLIEMAFQTLIRTNQGFSWRIVEPKQEDADQAVSPPPPAR